MFSAEATVVNIAALDWWTDLCIGCEFNHLYFTFIITQILPTLSLNLYGEDSLQPHVRDSLEWPCHFVTDTGACYKQQTMTCPFQ